MALHEIPEQVADVITSNESLRIRRDFSRMGKEISRALKEIRKSVAFAGKTNVVTKLGNDAADMLTAFNKGRELSDLILGGTETDVDGN
jgi:hypothetical protein